MRTEETGILLPAASGLLLTLSLPPFPIPILAPLALAPLAFHLARLPAGPRGTRDAALAGIVAGGLHALLLLHWLPGAARPLLGVLTGSGAALMVWTLNALLVGVVAVLAHRGASGGRVPLPLGLAAGWVTLGWASGSLPTMGFPWLGPEAALVAWPELLGVSEVVGSAGVAGFLALCGGGLGSWLAGKAAPGGTGRGWLAVALLLLGAGAAFGLVRAHQLQPAMDGHEAAQSQTIRMATLSMEAGPSLLANAQAREAHFPLALDTLMGQLAPGEAELVLWPESPTGTVGPAAEEELARRWAQHLGTPVLFGALDPEGDTHVESRPRRNRLFLARPHDRPDPALDRPGQRQTQPGQAHVQPVREKQRLIPILEPRPRSQVEAALDEADVTLDRAFSVPVDQGITMGALICFEALFSAEGLRQRREGALLLLLPMNEGWLADRGGGILDSARRQHEAVAVLRAVENRVPVVRSAVGGRAGAWGAHGRVLSGTERQVEGFGGLVVVELTPASPRPPLAAQGGAGVAGVLSLLLLVWAGVPIRSRTS